MKRRKKGGLWFLGVLSLMGWLLLDSGGIKPVAEEGEAPAGEDQIAGLERRIAAAAAPRPAGLDEVFDSNLPCAQLQTEKLKQRLPAAWRGPFWEESWQEDVDAAEAALQRIAVGEVAPIQPEPDGDTPYLERAYGSF